MYAICFQSKCPILDEQLLEQGTLCLDSCIPLLFLPAVAQWHILYAIQPPTTCFLHLHRSMEKCREEHSALGLHSK